MYSASVFGNWYRVARIFWNFNGTSTVTGGNIVILTSAMKPVIKLPTVEFLI